MSQFAHERRLRYGTAETLSRRMTLGDSGQTYENSQLSRNEPVQFATSLITGFQYGLPSRVHPQN